MRRLGGLQKLIVPIKEILGCGAIAAAVSQRCYDISMTMMLLGCLSCSCTPSLPLILQYLMLCASSCSQILRPVESQKFSEKADVLQRRLPRYGPRCVHGGAQQRESHSHGAACYKMPYEGIFIFHDNRSGLVYDIQ